MLVYIAGSGAMGCRFGYQIQNSGEEVILLDNWDDHIKSIQENGLKITGENELNIKIPIMYPQEATQKADLIILFTKAMQLEKMLQDIQGIIDENTKVLCLLNGLGHEDVIKKYVNEKNILIGVTVWTAGLKSPGVVLLQGVGTIDLQSLDAGGHEAGRKITDMLNAANLNANYNEDVLPSIWRKACVNGTMNSLCALLDATIGEVFSKEDSVSVVQQIIKEFVTVGQAEGIALNLEEITKYVFDTSVKAAKHYPSMHQDLVQHQRYTEIDYINGAVNRKAEKLGLDTPYCRLITQLIHAKEQLTIS
ncbi:MAG: 2-dehydropantoate 2-reductase [Culicoidibacterales bacterium]